MAKKKAGISEEVREAINEAARAGAYEAYKNTAGAYVNYFKAMETLLYNYKKLAALVADEEGYCEVEYHAGRKTFAAGSKSTGYYEQKTEADIIAEMQEKKKAAVSGNKVRLRAAGEGYKPLPRPQGIHRGSYVLLRRGLRRQAAREWKAIHVGGISLRA